MTEKLEIPSVPIHTTPPPLIDVAGTHLEMGRQIGEARREPMRQNVENAKKLLAEAYVELKLTWKQAQVQARKYLPFAEEYYPQYVEEMRGVSEGSNTTFEEIFFLNAMEGVTMDALHLSKCTNFAVNGDLTENGHVLIGHNEDWVPEDEKDIYLIRAKPQTGVPFLAMSYGGLLPNIGFNAAGIAQCCNTVRPNDSRIGIPRIIVSRAVLSAVNVSNAIQQTIVSHRAAGYNHLLAHESGELYNVEVSAKQFAVLYGEAGYALHTNHYLDEKMKLIDTTPTELIDTQIRYFRALRLLNKTRPHSAASLMEIQKDHFNHPYSICNHTMNALGSMYAKKTIVAMIIDLTERKMSLAWGNPCANAYVEFELNA